MFDVLLVPAAEKCYADAEPALARKLARCFSQLEREPANHPNIKRLTGVLTGYWRYRAGDHRVIYRIDHDARRVYVLRIVHRRDAY